MNTNRLHLAMLAVLIGSAAMVGCKKKEEPAPMPPVASEPAPPAPMPTRPQIRRTPSLSPAFQVRRCRGGRAFE